ncbi:MAG: TAT-variant-translocated molybdopterin oxidoreductase [Phycisphaerales bacterium]|nr:TAT-variant-translocated molybdopterin oxidoreductase [Phycisphaerales bacterium]
MAHDQCHSSVEDGKPLHKARTPHELIGAAGAKHWRGLDDLADTGEFRDFLEREFPDGASELLQGSRRTFLKLMGAGVALAGAATMPGCRRPAHEILPYSANVPESIIPGKSLFYATSRPLPGGGAEGLLVETHEGRPTKVEGNPLHPVNQGKSSEWSQASILALYDPDRLKEPEFRRVGKDGEASYVPATWDDFTAWSAKHFTNYDATHGMGLAFVVDKKTSPTRDALRDQIKKRWPDASWIAYDATENTAANAAISAVCGGPATEVLDISKAKIILSLDRDFLHFEPLSLVHARQWGAWRSVMGTKDQMCRLYCAESSFSGTGGSADHRVRVAPSQIPALVVAIAKKLGLSGPLAAGVGAAKVSDAAVDTKFVDAVAEDLAAHRGASLIVVGASQPSWVHALVAGLNSELGNVGQTVKFIPAGADRVSDGAAGLAKLAGQVERGEVKTLVCIETNPAFNAPAALKLEEKLAKAVADKKLTLIVQSVEDSETVEIANWRLNSTTYLESWGDVVAADGTLSAVQPMIAPLYTARSEIETLATILGQKPDGYDLVRSVWSKRTPVDFDKSWRKALWNGVAGNIAGAAMSVSVNHAADIVVNAAAGAAPSATSLDVVFECGLMADGSWANNAWLQELPHTASKVVWDNPAYCSPSTLDALNLTRPDETDKKPHGSLAEVTVGGASMVIAVWPVPGMPDNTLVLPLGNGRRKSGQVGTGVGFNTFLLKPAGAFSASGATVKGKGETYDVSCTQTHGSMEGRAIVRSVDLPAFEKHGDPAVVTTVDTYGRPKRLTLGERLEGGELNHMPANVSAYPNPFNGTRSEPTNEKGAYIDPARAGKLSEHAPYSQRVQWGMSIDLSACSGCNVCTIACQAENNIPVVGKFEVNKGREMQWIRVDRYFTGRSRDNPSGMVFQPVACVHCENAPCEVVCPVNATVHGPEGNNYMVYNR